MTVLCNYILNQQEALSRKGRDVINYTHCCMPPYCYTLHTVAVPACSRVTEVESMPSLFCDVQV